MEEVKTLKGKDAGDKARASNTKKEMERLKKENKDAQKRIEEYQSQIELQEQKSKERFEMLQKQIELLTSQQKTTKDTEKEDNQSISLNDNAMITVTSMCASKVILSTERMGRGSVYKLSGFGDKKSIRTSDLTKIIANNQSIFESGKVVLENKKTYVGLGLGYVFDRILSVGEVLDIIDIKTEEEVNLLLSLDKSIQDELISVLAERVVENGYGGYDMNFIQRISSKTNLNEAIEQYKDILEFKD